MRRSRVSSQFSTEAFCRVTLVENSGAKNSRGESRFPPGCEMPPKINFWSRLSFGKKVLRPLFSPVFPSFPALEYIVYNPMLDFLWKTQWKKWKTLWENRLLFHKISGKPGGKSEKFIPDRKLHTIFGCALASGERQKSCISGLWGQRFSTVLNAPANHGTITAVSCGKTFPN